MVMIWPSRAVHKAMVYNNGNTFFILNAFFEGAALCLVPLLFGDAVIGIARFLFLKSGAYKVPSFVLKASANDSSNRVEIVLFDF